MSQNYYASLKKNALLNTSNNKAENHFLKYNNLGTRFTDLNDKQSFVIGELDFGHGSNFIDTCKLWCSRLSSPNNNQNTLHYISFISQPIEPTEFAQCLKHSTDDNQICAELIRQYNLLLPGYHRLSFSHNIMLTLIIGQNHCKLNELDHHINAWYLNPSDLTSDNLVLNQNNCNELARLSNINESTSYVAELDPTSIGLTNLTTVGFTSLQHCHNKQNNHQILSGNYLANKISTFKPRHQPTYYARQPTTASNNQEIAIIGAGISGAATAFSLAKRGYKVTVYEKNPAPAMEASGNYQGMLYASWSAFGGAMMELSCSAYRYAHNLISEQLIPDIDYAPCGLIQLGHNPEQIRRNQQIIDANLPPDFLNMVNREQISALAGVELDTDLSGVYYPSGLWLNPPSLIKSLLQHPNIKLITNCQIGNVERVNDEWQLFDEQNRFIYKADCLVLCNAHYINQFSQTANIPMRKIRGQISISQQQNNLKTILCGAGYITPNKADKFTFGATFQFNDDSNEVRSQDHQLNLANLSGIIPEIANQIDITQLTGQTNFRASPHDYLPLVGPIAKYAEFKHDYAKLSQDKNARISPVCQYYKDLYLNLGHGAKGLLSAPLSGEIIADYIAGTPLACSESLRKALHPNRLYVHELVHSFKQTNPKKQ